jgi:hypothetical protein
MSALGDTWVIIGPPPKKRGVIKRHKIIAGVLGFALFAAGGALAAWFVSGGGGGYVKVGTLTAPSEQTPANGEIVGTIFPGETGPLTFKINNTNTVPLTINDWTPQGANFSVTGAAGTCPADSSTATFANKAGLSIPVPVGSSIVTIPNAVTLLGSASNGCQGATFAKTGSLTYST